MLNDGREGTTRGGQDRKGPGSRIDSIAPFVLVCIVGIASALRCWRLGDLALVGDESYYFLWSQKLALCYFDHPGGIAWLIRLSTMLGGTTELGIRWLNALLGVACVALTYAVTSRLFSSGAALMSSAVVAVSAPFLVTSRIVYTDTLPLFLLLLNLLQLSPILTVHKSNFVGLSRSRWIMIGLTWALLLNTKLSVYPYLIGLGAGVLMWRRSLRDESGFRLAAGVAAAGLAPLVIWNAAHDGAGLAWIWRHFTEGVPFHAQNLPARVAHIGFYFTPPMAVICLTGLLHWRNRTARWLILIALLLLMPVVLSPADSPRNLLFSSVFLIILSAAWFSQPDGYLHWRIGVFTLVFIAILVYGVGTTAGLVDETNLPQSTITTVNRTEAAGLRTLGDRLQSEEGLIFAVDYGLAAQLSYYAKRPVYTHFGQFLVWGIPDFTRITVLATHHVPPERTSQRMARAFQYSEGPHELELFEHGVRRTVRLWRGRDLRVSKVDFLKMFDLFSLLERRP
jgi:hypothetical protein